MKNRLRAFVLSLIAGTLIAGASVAQTTIPYTFANQSGTIPLSQLDANFTAIANETANVFASIAALRLNTSAAINTAYVPGYYGAGTPGGGDFEYVSTDTTSADNGGTIIVDAAGHRYHRPNTGSPSLFGAYGNGGHSASCSPSSSNTTIPCTASTIFGAPPVAGEKLVCIGAGATVSGEQPAPLETTVSSYTSGAIVAALAPSQSISGSGYCDWGTDDGAALAAALTYAGGGTVVLDAPEYFSTQALAVGNGTISWAHNLVARGRSFIDFEVSGNTTDLVPLKQATGNDPLSIQNVTFEANNTGRDCLSEQWMYGGLISNVQCDHSWRNCEARAPIQYGGLEFVMRTEIKLTNCGHHAIYRAVLSGYAYDNDDTTNGVEIEGYGLNSCGIIVAAGGPALPCSASVTGYISGTTLTISSVISGTVATGQNVFNNTTSGTSISSGSGSTWTVNHSQTLGSSGSPVYMTLSNWSAAQLEQLGAAVYTIITGPANEGATVWGTHFIGHCEINTNRDLALANGSDINPAIYFVADGAADHYIENPSGTVGAATSPVNGEEHSQCSIEDLTSGGAIPWEWDTEDSSITVIGVRDPEVRTDFNAFLALSNGLSFATGQQNPSGNIIGATANAGNVSTEIKGVQQSFGGPIINLAITADQSTACAAATGVTCSGNVTVPTAASTVTMGCTQTQLTLNPAGTLATLTIAGPCYGETYPNIPIDGQLMRMTTTKALSAITWDMYGSEAGAPASMSANTSISLRYNAQLNEWLPD